MAFLKPEALDSLLKERQTRKLKNQEDSKQIFENQIEELFGKKISSSGFEH